MKRTLCGLILLVTVGCSQSPTGPTSSPSIAAQLRWNVTSSSCGAIAPPPSQPAFAMATITEQNDGSVTASWPYLLPNTTREGVLYAHFVKENGSWAMCSWDVADV